MVRFEQYDQESSRDIHKDGDIVNSAGKKDARTLTQEKSLHEGKEAANKLEMEAKREILERSPEGIQKKINRIRSLRMRLKDKENASVTVGAQDRMMIDQWVENSAERLKQCQKQGFGIFPSGNPKDSFYNTMWSRDLAHAGGNFFAKNGEDALLASFEKIFLHQRKDGSIPYRVEKKYFLLEHLAHVFGINVALNRKKERAVYEGEDGGNAEDTIPAIIAAFGELFLNSEKGRDFIIANFDMIEKTMAQFIHRTDSEDGLELSKTSNPDWSDSLLKGGKKLGTINVWYCRALRMMQLMAEGADRQERSTYYRDLEHKVKVSILGSPENPGKLYDWTNHYFRTGEGEGRVDTAASIFGSLYLLPTTEAAKVQETFKAYLMSPSGLKNFYPPYPRERIFPPLRRIGMGGYHNEKVWPWITLQNIQVKIKIACEHPDVQVRRQYQQEAVADLIDQAKLFEEAGGAWEVFDPDTRRKATGLKILGRSYKPPQNLMGNLAAYASAYDQLKELRWIG